MRPIITMKTTPKQLSTLIRVINLGLVILAVALIGKVAMQTQLLRNEVTPRPVTGEGIPDEPADPTQNNQEIAPINLSVLASQGNGQQTNQPEQTVEKLPGDLELTGTITGSPRVARAIIRDLSNKEQTTATHYKIGDRLGAFTISVIERNRVILTANGKTFELTGNGPVSGETQTTESTLKPTARSTESEKPSGIYREDYAPSETEKNDSTVYPFVPADTLNCQGNFQAGRELIGTLLQAGDFSPWQWNNTTEGLRYTGNNLAIGGMKQALHTDDIIRSINGQVISSPQKAYQVFQKARTQEKIELEVLRERDLIRFTFEGSAQ